MGKLPAGAKSVMRGNRNPFGNPHLVMLRPCPECGGALHTLPEAVALYRQHLRDRPDIVTRARRRLAGHDLACSCPLPAPGEPDVCHAAVLLAVVAGEEP